MKKNLVYLILLTIALLSFACNQSTDSGALDAGSIRSAVATVCASNVESDAQGNKKNGDPVDAGRSDPTEALGPSDDVFFSLGYGGEVVLSFPDYVGGELYVYETTFGRPTYPEENADVYVSDDGTNWTLLGTASNKDTEGISIFRIPSELCVMYVKIVDTTDSGLHGATSDGYDLDAVCAEYTRECEQDCEPLEVNLIAGQHMIAGSVTVTNDEDYLYITYTTTGDWVISETHLDVEITPADFPTTKGGSPKVGHFTYQMEHDPEVTEYTYILPLEDLGYELGDEIYIAAHAVVLIYDEFDEVIQEETAWGEGDRFVDKGNWAMYFMYTIQECVVEVCGEELEIDLVAGQTMDAGSVTIWNNEEYLYITYSVTGDWLIAETQAEVVKSVDDFPTTPGGNPQIGLFTYKTEHDPEVTEFTYVIPLDDLDCSPGDELYIATHATLVIYSGGEIIQTETGWGDGIEFNPSGSWAMYFMYTVQRCVVED